MVLNLKIPKSIIIGFITVFSLVSAGLFSGCTSQNTNPKGTVHVSYPVLSEIDRALLNNAYEEYESLKQNHTYTQARQQLLTNLNNQTGVEKAELGLDNYTIFVTYSDGDFGMVDTFELDEMSSQEGFSPFIAEGTPEIHESPGVYHQTQYNLPSSSSKTSFDIIVIGPGDKITAEKKKVLVLGPCYYEFDKEPIDQCVQQFKDNGWTDDDIAWKVITTAPWEPNSDCLALTPEDYFNLADYGIVLFTGHGAVKIFNNYDETNLYLQFCFLDNASFANNPKLEEWQDKDKLVIGRTFEYEVEGRSEFIYTAAIRADLLREQMSTLPSSFVYFATCYGGYFNKIFLDHGAKTFLGWDDEVRSQVSDTDMLSLVTLLLEKDNSVYKAYQNSNVIQKDLAADLFIYPIEEIQNAYYYYYPAWIDLTVTNIPEGTSFLKTIIQNDLGVTVAETEEQVLYGATQIKCEELKKKIIPSSQNITITVTACDSGGGEISTAPRSTIFLPAGLTTKQIAFTVKGDRPYVAYTYEGFNITVDLSVSSSKWENGKDITATATCTCSSPTIGVPGFNFYLKGASSTIVGYSPEFPDPNDPDYGHCTNGTDAYIGWGMKQLKQYGNSYTFSVTFHLDQRTDAQPYIMAYCSYYGSEETFAKIYLQ